MRRTVQALFLLVLAENRDEWPKSGAKKCRQLLLIFFGEEFLELRQRPQRFQIGFSLNPIRRLIIQFDSFRQRRHSFFGPAEPRQSAGELVITLAVLFIEADRLLGSFHCRGPARLLSINLGLQGEWFRR